MTTPPTPDTAAATRVAAAVSARGEVRDAGAVLEAAGEVSPEASLPDRVDLAIAAALVLHPMAFPDLVRGHLEDALAELWITHRLVIPPLPHEET